MNIGAHVAVNFTSENATEFSGLAFSGAGKVDYIENNYVFGRLYSGQPFMCSPSDVKVIIDEQNIDEYYRVLLSLKLISIDELQQLKSKQPEDMNLVNMCEFGLYIYAQSQANIHLLAQHNAELQLELLQLKESKCSL